MAKKIFAKLRKKITKKHVKHAHGIIKGFHKLSKNKQVVRGAQQLGRVITGKAKMKSLAPHVRDVALSLAHKPKRKKLINDISHFMENKTVQGAANVVSKLAPLIL